MKRVGQRRVRCCSMRLSRLSSSANLLVKPVLRAGRRFYNHLCLSRHRRF
jgi:hypothetical protein